MPRRFALATARVPVPGGRHGRVKLGGEEGRPRISPRARPRIRSPRPKPGILATSDKALPPPRRGERRGRPRNRTSAVSKRGLPVRAHAGRWRALPRLRTPRRSPSRGTRTGGFPARSWRSAAAGGNVHVAHEPVLREAGGAGDGRSPEGHGSEAPRFSDGQSPSGRRCPSKACTTTGTSKTGARFRLRQIPVMPPDGNRPGPQATTKRRCRSPAGAGAMPEG